MFNAIKSTLFRGLLILIPMIIVYVTIRELMELMVGMATPIADLFPEGTFDHEKETEIIAFLLIVGMALLLGTLAAAKPIARSARWIEDQTLNRIPVYRVTQSLVAAFIGMENEDAFMPALLTIDGGRKPVYVVEDQGHDHIVVMIPWTPTPFAGELKLVTRDCVELLPISLDEFSLALTHFGLGLADIVAKHSKAISSNGA